MDVGIVIALKEEFREFFKEIKESSTTVIDEKTGSYFYTFDHRSAQPDRSYKCVVTWAGQMGPTKAALVTQTLLNKYSPATVVNLGIAGGMSKDISLGEVIVATVVDNYLERSRAVAGIADSSFNFELSGEPFRCSGDLIKAVQNLEFAHPLSYQGWLDKCAAAMSEAVPEDVKSKLLEMGLLQERASSHEGHIASGVTVGATTAFNDWLKKKDRSFLGLEMEAGAVMAAVFEQVQPSRSLVLRGVSDLADERKAKLDKIKGGALRRCAMQNAIYLLWTLLELSLLPLSDSSSTPQNLPDVPKHNLPTQITSLVGRKREINQIKRFLDAKRLVTLTGTGGIGKTRVALQTALEIFSEFANGVALVELASLSDANFVTQAVASSFGVREAAEKPLEQELINHLQSKELLLVLDNCEHLREACARLCASLLRQCPRLRILCTSREQLDVAGEQEFIVLPLPTPDSSTSPVVEDLVQFDAVKLFADRAALKQPTFAITSENASATAKVCSRLDGIPLALELAAARVKTLTVQQIADRLDDRFSLLTSGPSTAPQRQQTLQATIDWSYDLLSPNEKSVFERLSVFADGWMLDAAEAVCAGGGIQSQEVLDLVESLADKSLIIAEHKDQVVRFRMLETIRDYARKQLEKTPDQNPAYYSLLVWGVKLVLNSVPQLRGPDQLIWLSSLETEHSNLRTAFIWWNLVGRTRCDFGVDLAAGLGEFWSVRGYYSEGRLWLGAALAGKEKTKPSQNLAEAYRWAGDLAFLQRDLVVAEVYVQASLTMYKALNDKRGISLALGTLGRFARFKGDHNEARKLHEQSLEIKQEFGTRADVATSLMNIANADASQGNMKAAREGYEKSLAIQQKIENSLGVANAKARIAHLALTEKQYDEAWTGCQEALILFQQLKNQDGIAMCLFDMACISVHRNDYEAARAGWRQSLLIFQELQVPEHIVSTQHNLANTLDLMANAAWTKGHHAIAWDLFGESLILWQQLDNQERVAMTMGMLATRYLYQRKFEEAKAEYWKVLTIYHKISSLSGIATMLYEIGVMAYHQGQPKRAVRLQSAGEALKASHKVPISLPNVEQNARQFSKLDDETFVAVWSEGQAMTPDQAVEYALSEKD